MNDFWEQNAPLMALQYIRRWALIRMDRDQTVGDHAFRVWVLARDLYKRLNPTSHNSFENLNTQLWALIHDADEHWISDLPGHVKAALNKDSPGIFDKYTEKKFAKVMPWFLDVKRGLLNTPVEPIVKICDLVESALYSRQHCIDPTQKSLVWSYIDGRLGQVVASARLKYATIAWDVVGPWTDDVMRGEPVEQEELRLTIG